MINEAFFSVTGYVATDPTIGRTRGGVLTLSMRVGWTPRRFDKDLQDWADEPSSFVSVRCFRRVAANGAACLHRGDPVLVKGTLRVREYKDTAGAKRISVDVVADTLGHDMSRGVSTFNRTQASRAQTALERAQAERDALGLPPLPEDLADLDPALIRGRGSGAALDQTAGAGVDTADLGTEGQPVTDQELGDLEDEEFDEDEASDLLLEQAEEPAALPA